MIVGYSGYVIVARTGGVRLDDLACVDDLFVAVTDDIRAGGWRIGYLDYVDENETSTSRLARELARETDAPAIVLSVFDSDCAFATAADPAGSTVEFHLDEEVVRDLAEGYDFFEPLNRQALPGLLAWAERAGLVADPAGLAAALESRPGPPGDGIGDLADALGIAPLPHQGPPRSSAQAQPPGGRSEAGLGQGVAQGGRVH